MAQHVLKEPPTVQIKRLGEASGKRSLARRFTNGVMGYGLEEDSDIFSRKKSPHEVRIGLVLDACKLSRLRS